MRLIRGRGVDAGCRIGVTYQGLAIGAHPGDTLASALMAAERPAIGRSAVDERWRGLRWLDRTSELSVRVDGVEGVFDPTALLLEDGMRLYPSPTDASGGRRTADGEDETDILIVGAGPAGLAAALAASHTPLRIMLAEHGDEPGGAQRWSGDDALCAWAEDAISTLRARGVDVVAGVRVDRSPAGTWWIEPARTGTAPRPRPRLVRARQTIWAAGALDRMIAFSGNDLPGVMTAGTLRVALARWGVLPGRRVAVLAANDTGARVLAEVERAGAEPVALVDVRSAARPDVPCRAFPASVVSAALGGDRLEAIEIAGPAGRQTVDCDTLAVAAGWSPAIGPIAGDGHSPLWNPTIAAWLSPPGAFGDLQTAGAAGGIFTPRAAMKSGYFRARRAAASLGAQVGSVSLVKGADTGHRMAAFWHVPGPGPSYLDFTHDVTTDTSANDAANDRLAQDFLADPSGL